MSKNPPKRPRTIILLQLQDPLDMEAYATRLKAEAQLVVRTDKRSPRRPDLILTDRCLGRVEGTPALILTRSRARPYAPECECCNRTPAGARWPALMDQIYSLVGAPQRRQPWTRSPKGSPS